MPEGPEIVELARSYVVLDVRPQSVEFRRNINTSVHDALWALSMQWRLKEFQGEDTGSNIYSKVHIEKTKLTRFQSFSGPAEVYDSEVPLETQVEREYIQHDLGTHLQLGRYWRKLLLRFGLFDYHSLFVEAFPINDGSTYQQLSNVNAMRIRNVTSGRTLAGGDLLDYISETPGLTAEGLATHVETTELSIPSAKFSDLGTAMNEYQSFYSRLFSQPENDSCWNKNRLEYSFKSSVSDNASGDQTVFESEEYHGGGLDWFNFDIQPGSFPLSGVTIDDDVQESEKLSVVPMTVSFPGMPLDRWWEMQRGNINYAAIRPGKTGLLGMIVKDFLINYNNDWSLIPYDVPVGSYTKIRSIVVRDVFGDDIYVGGELATSATSGGGISGFPDLSHSENIDIDPVTNTITKNGPYGWNAGGFSTESISGNGFVERTLGGALLDNYRTIIGLSYSYAGLNEPQVFYSLQFEPSDTVRVEVNNSYVGLDNSGVPFEIGDKLRVERLNSEIIFSRIRDGQSPLILKILDETIPSGSDGSLHAHFTIQNNGKKIFGLNFEEDSASQGSGGSVSDDKWSVYKLNEKNNFYNWDSRLFIPPALPQIIEGENLDVVNFFRDQMANMAWALETRIPDELGGFKNGTDAELELKKYLKGVYEDKDPASAPQRPLDINGEYAKPSLKYTAITYVPENWIPLIPQHKAGSFTKIDLKRATLPRVMENKDIDYDDPANYVSPRTKIMREGLDETIPTTYSIADEEVPRSGIYVSRSFQRSRWHNGKVFLWMGRRKKTGRGEGLSGLVFDSVSSEENLLTNESIIEETTGNSGFSGFPDFTNLQNIEIANEVITKSGPFGWNAGGFSVQAIEGNGYVERTLGGTLSDNQRTCVGLSYSDDGFNKTTMNYAMEFQSNEQIRIEVNGGFVSGENTEGPFLVGEKFRIERQGSTITFSNIKNDNTTVIMHTIDEGSTNPESVGQNLYADFSIANDGKKIFGLNLVDL